MDKKDVVILDCYRVHITNRNEPIFVCASCFLSAIRKVNKLIHKWEDSDKYSIMSISYVSPCLY